MKGASHTLQCCLIVIDCNIVRILYLPFILILTNINNLNRGIFFDFFWSPEIEKTV